MVATLAIDLETLYAKVTREEKVVYHIINRFWAVTACERKANPEPNEFSVLLCKCVRSFSSCAGIVSSLHRST